MDNLGNAALGKSETYHAKCEINSEFEVNKKVKDLVDSMPVYNDNIALSLSKKQVGAVRNFLATSIVGKLQSEEDTKTYESILKYAKGRKKTSPLSEGLCVC